ncbi:MAG TPA: beta-galactosidase trimerization domain-containing protein [Caldilineaceae bacterium]|nr:beta-galactosidase trimerization domain-containing protein [Caldilineaceae bacterium]
MNQRLEERQVIAAPPKENWFDRPMRWAQLTLTETNPAEYDVNFWLDFFKQAQCDAACLSAGGCVAYYPTQIPLHFRSPWLGDRDAFGELYEGCRRLGMNVIARTDPHAVHQEVFDAHPDWIMVGPDGQPVRHWADPDLWVTCALGPYNFEFMTEVHREIMQMYPVDGIFSNRWTGHGICYCEHCQHNFKKATGYDLPHTTEALAPMRLQHNRHDPAFKAYLQWRQDRLFELWDVWDCEIRAIQPHARYIPNSGGAHGLLDMKRIGEKAEILFADRQARRGLQPIWSNGRNGKEFRSTLGRKPIGGIFSMGVEERYRWKDSIQNPAEVRMFVADGVANGLRPWFTKFGGMIYDPRWLQPVAEMYRLYAQWEPYLRNEAPLARVALVYSQQTWHYYGGERAVETVDDHLKGFYHALIEARIPFEMVHDGLLDAEHIQQFKTLILPNVAALSDQQCQQLREFVQRGGSLVATYETSLYDELGNQRADFGLADLFGASYAGGIEGPMKNSYLAIERDPLTRVFHPLVAGLEEAGRIINGVHRVKVETTTPLPYAPLTLIPSYPDLPMEMVWPRVNQTDIPQVYMRQVGAGRVVYFPWDIDRSFWEVLCVDHGKLLTNAVEWATNEERPVTVTGPGVLDVTVWRQKSSMTVHLVNLTNPMMMKGPIRELIPVGEQTVRLRLPGDKQVARVHLLRAGVTPTVQMERDALTVRVPSILDHEVVAVDFVQE